MTSDCSLASDLVKANCLTNEQLLNNAMNIERLNEDECRGRTQSHKCARRAIGLWFKQAQDKGIKHNYAQETSLTCLEAAPCTVSRRTRKYILSMYLRVLRDVLHSLA